MKKPLEFAVVLLERLRPSDWQRTLAWAALVGFTGALATLGFRIALGAVETLLYGTAGGLVEAAESLSWWHRLVAPAVGGLLAGLVLVALRRLPQRTPHGDYMEATVLGRGDLPVASSLLRALSSACSVIGGGAIGREGPMVQLAALTGSVVARWLGMPVPRRRLLVACGAAAGLATAYGAPIAGALFIAEIVLQSLATETLAALLIASVCAHATVAALVGTQPLYTMPPVSPTGAALGACGVLGFLAGVCAPVYLGLLDLSKAAFAAWRVPLPLKLAAGGLAVGLLSLQAPQVWGNGFSVVNGILQGHWVWQGLVIVLALKLAAVAATTGSGAVGGIFTPTLFVGAASGGLFALAADAFWPGALPVPAGAAIGMGAFLAASTHAPLTSILMIFEMTENYGIVAPLMLACVLAFSFSRLIRPDSIYASSQRAKAVADPRVATARDLVRDESITVVPGDSIEAVEQRLVESRWRHVYVVDAGRVFLGAIAMHDLVGLLKEAHDAGAPWPPQLLQSGYPRLAMDMPLWEVLRVFEDHPGERLPVLDAAGRLAGHIAKTDLVLMLRDQVAVA
ncbi:MAG TPA: ClcB-like voltage-gated chloride channel protein [Ramlibacter sp.]|uniref:ClcB-like voltage-gated chloride channel protein n=1 Tax=Ramlibacter sp. TaxID=1917967 RepID=UPI002B6EF757|nr:ClcB-like voltage-gated chloride channel protein [Ramlibacter sp.]HVZ46677.1 ClcB-like voltage-gated chloride channel protein [Ramlibacter sp.]